VISGKTDFHTFKVKYLKQVSPSPPPGFCQQALVSISLVEYGIYLAKIVRREKKAIKKR
jgi:hypothetical protein